MPGKNRRINTHPEYSVVIAERYLRKRLREDYGLTLMEYNQMLRTQRGVCAICNKPETSTNRYGVKLLAVDHNHTTGKVRALLCNRCNILVGKLEEKNGLKEELIRSVVAYLVEHENFSL